LIREVRGAERALGKGEGKLRGKKSRSRGIPERRICGEIRFLSNFEVKK